MPFAITNTNINKVIIKKTRMLLLILILILILPNNTTVPNKCYYDIALQVMAKLLNEKGAFLPLI